MSWKRPPLYRTLTTLNRHAGTPNNSAYWLPTPKKIPVLYKVANPARGQFAVQGNIYAVPVVYSFLDVCMYDQHFQQSMDQPGVVASPARGHLYLKQDKRGEN